MKTTFYIFFVLVFFTACKNTDSQTTSEIRDAAAYHNPMIAPLTNAIEADPDNADLYFQRSVALNKIKQDDLVVRDLQKALALDSNNILYRESIAVFLLGLNRADEALPHIKILQTTDPQKLDFQLLRVEAYTAKKQYSEAQILLDSLQKNHGAQPMLLYDYSKLMAAKGDTAKALEYALKTVVIAPTFYDGRYQVADLYKAQNNILAVKWYEDLHSLDTLNANPLYDAAQFYLIRGNKEAAKAYLRQTIKTDKDFALAYLDYGKILLKQDSLAKAERQFDILIDVQPNMADAYYYKGYCAMKNGKKDLAKALFNQTLTFNPKHAEAKKHLQQLP